MTLRQKLVLCASHRCGFSQTELAVALSVSEQAVNQMIARAKAKLLARRAVATTEEQREAIDALLN